MWVFLNDAFASIVQENGSATMLRVRARFSGDLERAFPVLKKGNEDMLRKIGGTAVHEPAVSDYRYHATLPRSYVAEVIRNVVDFIDYNDFKRSIPHDAAGELRHQHYSRAWSVMNGAQRLERDRELSGWPAFKP